MAISNVETEASKVDYDARTHRSNSKDRNSKIHNAHAKSEQPSGDEPRKEDSVAISDEARQLSEWREQISRLRELKGQEIVHENPLPELRYNVNIVLLNIVGYAGIVQLGLAGTDSQDAWGAVHKSQARDFIFNSLDGKVEKSQDVSVQLGNMLFVDSFADDDLEMRAANREAARDLAKRIAENYIDNPEEAQAFIDKINKFIEDAEKLDKGYFGGPGSLLPPDPPKDDTRWFAANFDKYFGHLNETSSKEEFNEARRVAAKDLHDLQYANWLKNPAPYKVWESRPSWEEEKAMNCDPRFTIYSEENKAWYKEFLAKSNLIQNLINNAKLITDFSGNERWNVVMNLLASQQPNHSQTSQQ